MRSLLLTFVLLLTAVWVPAYAQQALPGVTAGVQYDIIVAGQPYPSRPPGRVEVAEIFAYTCPHCAHFAPMLDTWAKQLPAHAKLVFVPGVFDRDDPWSRAFFAAQASKSLTVLHPRLFAAIHETGDLPRNADTAQIIAFASKVQGVNAAAFKAAMLNNASLLPKLKAAYEFAARSEVQGTPSIIVAGRYRIRGDSYEGLLANTLAVVNALAPRRAAPAKLSATPAVKPAAKPATAAPAKPRS